MTIPDAPTPHSDTDATSDVRADIDRPHRFESRPGSNGAETVVQVRADRECMITNEDGGPWGRPVGTEY